MKFIKTKVTQRLLVGDEYTAQKVKGYLIGDSGLNLVKSYESWAISHERSGKLIFEVSLPFSLAKQMAIETASLLDWTKHEDVILNQTIDDNDLRHKLNLIRDVKRETFQIIINHLKKNKRNFE